MSGQPSLLSVLEREERPRKKVRKVSKQIYAELRDSDRLGKSQHRVLTALAHYYNARADWPTTAELARWMFDHGKLTREAVNLIAPRVSDLVNGEWSKRKRQDGQIENFQKGGGVCEFLPARLCRITGDLSHPIRIREAGSRLSQLGYSGLR